MSLEGPGQYPPKLTLVPSALLPCSLGSEPRGVPFWKLQYVLTLDASTSRWTGLAGWRPVDKNVTCQQELFSLFPLQFRAGLQPTGREIIESDLLKYNSKLIS